MIDDPATGSMRGAYGWAAAGQVASLAVVVLLDVARARLFTPGDIGLFVTGMWLLGLVQLLGEGGIGAVVVSERGLDQPRLYALGRVATILAFAGALLMLAASPLVTSWTGSAIAGPVAASLAPAALLAGLAVVPRGLLVRRLDFRSIVRTELAATLLQLVATVAAALLGAGIWALIAGVTVGQGARAVFFRRDSGPTHAPRIDASELPRQLRHAANITGSRAVSYGYSNADYFVLSRWASLDALGVYFNAFRLATLPGLVVTNVVSQVSFPAFAAAGDREQLRARFLSTVRLAAVFAFPCALGMIVAAEWVVRTLYGSQWLGVVPVLQVLALMGLSRALQIIGPSALLAVGMTRTNLWISVLYAVLLIPGFLIGVQRGAIGVATAWAVIGVPLDLAVLLISGRAIGVDFSSLLRAIAPSCLRAVVMALCVALLLRWLPERSDSASLLAAASTLLAAGALGAAVYGGWTLLAEPDLRKQALDLLRSRRLRGP